MDQDRQRPRGVTSQKLNSLWNCSKGEAVQIQIDQVISSPNHRKTASFLRGNILFNCWYTPKRAKKIQKRSKKIQKDPKSSKKI
jgi:hypothetical protein